VAVPLSWVQDGIAKDHPTQEIDMTSGQKVARRKLSLLELAQELGNVSRAYQVMGYSRQQFYEIQMVRASHRSDCFSTHTTETQEIRSAHPSKISSPQKLTKICWAHL
jgi:hypothetical protein